MGHGLYNGGVGMQSPWVMGCTTVPVPHGSWIVQQCWCSMGHGLYNGTEAPWVKQATWAWLAGTGLKLDRITSEGNGHTPDIIPGM